MSCRFAWAALAGVALLVGACGSGDDPAIQAARPPLQIQPTLPAGEVPTSAISPRFLSASQLMQGVLERVRPIEVRPPVHPVESTDPGFTVEQEPNNQETAARPVKWPGVLQGFVDPLAGSADGDHDWFTFDIERDQPGVLELKLSGVPQVDIAFEVYLQGTQGHRLLARASEAGTGKDETIPNLRLVNGSYLIHVFQTVPEKAKPGYNLSTAYRMEATLSNLPNDRETEPNNRYVDALPVTAPFQMAGVVNSPGDNDWFVLDLTQASPFSLLDVELLPSMGQTMTLTVMTTAREPIVSGTAEQGRRVRFPNIAVLPGSSAYLLRVESYYKDPSGGTYELKVANPRVEQHCELEPNGSADMAVRLHYEEALTGWLAPREEEDWFRIQPLLTESGGDEGNDASGETLESEPLARTGVLRVTVRGLPGVNLVVETYDADGETLLGRYDRGGVGDGEEIPNNPLPERDLYLRVSASSGTNPDTAYTVIAEPLLAEGMELEPNNLPQEAMHVLDLSTELKGYLAPAGDRDCLVLPDNGGQFSVKAPSHMQLKVTAYDRGLALLEQRHLKADQLSSWTISETGLVLCLEEEGEPSGPMEPYVLGRDIE